MLDIKFLRENIAVVKEMLKYRGEEANIEQFLQYDQERRNLLKKVEELKHQRNTFSQKIAELRKKGLKEEQEDIFQMKEISVEIKKLPF